MRHPEMALQLAGDDIDALNILVKVLAKDPATAALAEQARDRAFSALQSEAREADAPATTVVQIANALVEREKYEDAIP